MHWIWLSHVLDSATPQYGGSGKLEIQSASRISQGASCNSSLIILPNHTGSHVDAPNHFIDGGKTLEDYSPEQWIFGAPKVLDCPCDQPELIGPEVLPDPTPQDEEVDLLLFRTGFELYRQERRYWELGPGLSPRLAEIIKQRFPRLKAVGVDFISINSYQHRPAGREAHKIFLGNEVLLFEDLRLHETKHQNLTQVIALPLRFQQGDGAPCSMIAQVD